MHNFTSTSAVTALNRILINQSTRLQNHHMHPTIRYWWWCCDTMRMILNDGSWSNFFAEHNYAENTHWKQISRPCEHLYEYQETFLHKLPYTYFQLTLTWMTDGSSRYVLVATTCLLSHLVVAMWAMALRDHWNHSPAVPSQRLVGLWSSPPSWWHGCTGPWTRSLPPLLQRCACSQSAVDWTTESIRYLLRYILHPLDRCALTDACLARSKDAALPCHSVIHHSHESLPYQQVPNGNQHGDATVISNSRKWAYTYIVLAQLT